MAAPTSLAESGSRRSGRRRSTDHADVLLAVAPPYHCDPWLGMGIPVIHGMLKQSGITPSIVRLLDDIWSIPAPVLELSWLRMARPVAAEESAAFLHETMRPSSFLFDMVEKLLAGSERVFGFSIWRHNLDVTLELARLLKEACPDALVILGGPQAIEAPATCQVPSVDVVIHGAAEALAVPVFRAALDRRLGDVAGMKGVFVNDRHGVTGRRLLAPEPTVAALPDIDYASIVPVLVDDEPANSRPRIPVLLNLGCPFRCSFCTNTTIYPTMEWGSVERVLCEVETALETWARFSPDHNCPPELAFCDATVNAQPPQWDVLMKGLGAPQVRRHAAVLHGCMIVDERVTARRVEAFMEAGYAGGFFGLETASVRLRKMIKKPGRIAAVRDGVQALHDGSQGRFRVSVGVIIGHPCETEQDHYETVSFLEWMDSLGILAEINASPLYKTPAAMDPALLQNARGVEFGIAWRDDGPAGDPAVRGRRLLSIFHHFEKRVRVDSPIPKRLNFGTLMPELAKCWFEDVPQTASSPAPVSGAVVPDVRESEQKVALAAVSDFRLRYEPLLRAAVREDTWALMDVFDHRGDDDTGDAVVALYRRRGEASSAAIVVTPRDDRLPAYRRLSGLNIAYLTEFQGVACVFDNALLQEVAVALENTV